MSRNVSVDTNALLARISRDGPDSPILFREAVALMAARTRTPPNEELSLAKDRVAQRIRDAMKRGNISSTVNVREAKNATFTVDAFVRWARACFSGKSPFSTAFDDLPIKLQACVAVGYPVAPAATAQGFAHATPGTLSECGALIGEQNKTIRELQALEADALAWREEQARKAARNRGGRPPNKKSVAKKPS